MVSKLSSPSSDSASKSSRKKYKKNAMEYVDYTEEFKKDPKFKTELCNTFTDTGFCAYGNKCRFAHGKEELFEKVINHPKYRKSDCITFHTNGFCFYGQRCHFKHHEMRTLDKIDRSYYTLRLQIYSEIHSENSKTCMAKKIVPKRLNIFQEITGQREIFSNHAFPDPSLRFKLQQHYEGLVNNLTRMINLNNTNFISKPQFPFSADRKSSGSSFQSIQSRSPLSPMSPDESMVVTGHGKNSELHVSRKLNFNYFPTNNQINTLNRLPYYQ